MTDWDRHYATKGTLRQAEQEKVTDLRWRIFGWALGLVAMGYIVSWMIGAAA